MHGTARHWRSVLVGPRHCSEHTNVYPEAQTWRVSTPSAGYGPPCRGAMRPPAHAYDDLIWRGTPAPSGRTSVASAGRGAVRNSTFPTSVVVVAFSCPTRRTQGTIDRSPALPRYSAQAYGLAEHRHVDVADLAGAAHPVDCQSQLADLHVLRDVPEFGVLGQDDPVQMILSLFSGVSPFGWLLVVTQARRGTPTGAGNRTK